MPENLIRVAALSLAALTLAACDSAGTVLDDTARLAAVEQCRQVSEGAGIAGPAVTRVCNCAADKWLDKPVAERVDISPAAIRTIINECAGTDAKASETPASSESY
jgi:hypothetical protein